MTRILWVLVGLVLLAGCVTTSSGGPAPAAREVQLKAHLDLARGYLEQRNWNRARDPIRRALEIDPRSAEAYALMGVMYQGQQEWELAEQAYRRALRNDPRHALALNNYASFLYAEGRFEDALEPLRTLVRDPAYRDRARAYESLGLTELKVGNAGRAKAAFERALSFNVVLPRSSLELAQIAFDEGNFQLAGEHYEMFRRTARQTPGSLCLGIRLARRAGDEDQAASYEIALRNLYPNAPEIRSCTRSEG
jgi:type IV pilus assembly protein PilF